jgi:hypothetical protein
MKSWTLSRKLNLQFRPNRARDVRKRAGSTITPPFQLQPAFGRGGRAADGGVMVRGLCLCANLAARRGMCSLAGARLYVRRLSEANVCARERTSASSHVTGTTTPRIICHSLSPLRLAGRHPPEGPPSPLPTLAGGRLWQDARLVGSHEFRRRHNTESSSFRFVFNQPNDERRCRLVNCWRSHRLFRITRA